MLPGLNWYHKQMTPPDHQHVLILGLGNLLLQDEGLGILSLQWLQKTYAWPANVTLMDGGVMGLELLPYIEACDAVCIIDAVRSGRKPGTLVRLKRDEIPAVIALKYSVHQVGFQETMAMLQLRGTVPHHMVLWGIEPEHIALGMSLSPAVASKMPLLSHAVVEQLVHWGITPLCKKIMDTTHITAIQDTAQQAC